MHQRAQRHQRGLLLADGEILGKILAQLAGNQLRLPHIRLPHAQILNHRQPPMMSHQAAHVQMPVLLQGQVCLRMMRRNLHVSSVGHCRHLAQRPIAGHRDGDGSVLFLHHHAQHGRGRHQPAHGRQRRGRRRVNLRRLPGHGRGAAQEHSRLSVHQGNMQHFIGQIHYRIVFIQFFAHC